MDKPTIETLHGLIVSETEVTIAVTSNGCTDKDDFQLVVKETKQPQVTFQRVRLDPCRMVQHTVDIAFSLKDIGTFPFTVDNPFEPGPPRLGGERLPADKLFPTHSWCAIADLEPPAPFSLRVNGKVTVPTPGYRAALTRAVPQGINPTQLILDLIVTRLPVIVPQVVTDIDATYVDNNYAGGLQTVAIRYQGGIVEVIDIQEVR